MSTTQDWTVLELPGILDIAQQAASSVARTYDIAVMDKDDLYQEAMILLTQPVRAIRVRQQYGAFQEDRIAKELQHDLIDKIRTDVNRSNRTLSREKILDGWSE